MIPDDIQQFLRGMDTPDFFIRQNRERCQNIHESLQHEIMQGTVTLNVNIDYELLVKVEEVLQEYGWTPEEAMVLFLMWAVVCPEKFRVWCRNKEGNNC